MNENEKKEAIDAEVKETKKEEKKEGSLSKFFNKAKASINSSVLENKIQNSYNKDKNGFQIFEKDNILGRTYSGEFKNDDKDAIIIFGEHEFKKGSVCIDQEKDTAYYVISVEPTTVKAIVDGVEYERKGTIINLDKNVEEVNVIKAGKRFFIYKG